MPTRAHGAGPWPRPIRSQRLRPPTPAAAVRIGLRRRALIRQVLALAVAGAAVALVPDRSRGGSAPGAVTGPLAPLAATDLAPGSVIDADDLRWIPLPDGVVRADDPTGAVVVAAVAAGEIVTPSRLARGRLGLDAGERAVLVSAVSGQPPLVVGDMVELIAVRATDPTWSGRVTDGASAGTGVEATRLGATGRVVALGDDGAVVAVPTAAAPEIVAAQALGAVTLVLTPWTG